MRIGALIQELMQYSYNIIQSHIAELKLKTYCVCKLSGSAASRIVVNSVDAQDFNLHAICVFTKSLLKCTSAHWLGSSRDNTKKHHAEHTQLSQASMYQLCGMFLCLVPMLITLFWRNKISRNRL